MVAGLFATPASGRGQASATAEPHRALVFSPDRPERCDFFFVTEFNAGMTGVESQDALDKFLFTDAIGLMWNADRSRAIGVSIDAHLANGALRFVPTLRAKQWLTGRSSMDLSLGYAFTSIEQDGITGAIFQVRYSPTQWIHLQAGGCRVREVSSIWYFPDYHVEEVTQFRIYGGVGLGGVPAVVAWGAQAVGFATVVALFAGSN